MSDIGKKVLHDGVTYECVPRGTRECCDCAFVPDNTPEMGLCTYNDCEGGVYVATAPEGQTLCGKCENGLLPFDKEPCNTCRQAPKGQYPKFKKGPPVAQEIQIFKPAVYTPILPPAPEGEGWRRVTSGMLPCGYHEHVEIQFRDGSGGAGKAGDLDWGQSRRVTDIVRYRVVVEPARNGRSAVVDQPCASTPVVDQIQPNVSDKPSNPKDIIGIRKAPLSCLPMNVVAELGTALLEGASKYGRHNFRAVGVRSGVYFDATMRHLVAYWEGEDIDPDSGMSHLTKAMASLAVWRDAQMQGKCEDDRPPRSVPFYPRLNELAGQILDRHADKSPKHYTLNSD